MTNCQFVLQQKGESTMSDHRNIFILTILLIILACSKPPEYPVKIETIDGIKVITNPDYPRDGQVKYEMVEELNIGIEEGDEDYILNRPGDIKVSDCETIYILDWGDVNIKVYNKKGKYLRTIGRPGQGPGEFDTPCDFDLGTDGNIYLMDSRNTRVEIVDTIGVYVAGFRLSGGYNSGMVTDDSSHIYFSKKHYRETEEIESEISIYRYTIAGKELLNYGNFTDAKQIAVRTGPTSSLGIMSRMMPTTVWTVDKMGRLFQGYNANYQLSVYHYNGDLAFKFGREFTPIKLNQPKHNMSNLTAEQKRLNDKYNENLPKFKPAFKSHLLFDDNGNLWIEIETKDEYEGRIYDVFSPEGIYLKQVFVEHRIFQLKNDKAYSIIKTENEFRVVKQFRLVEIGEWYLVVGQRGNRVIW
jgi:hypothetical protein